MGKRVGLIEASAITGLSKHELRTGALSGKYPYYRIGQARGRMLFDIDLLEERIRELMLDNTDRIVEKG